MQSNLDSKNQVIADVVAKLRDRFGEDAFDIANNWEDDPDAIGIVSPADHGRQAYIALYGDKFYVELELPPVPGSELPYELAGRYDDIDFLQLVSVLATHLNVNEPRESR